MSRQFGEVTAVDNLTLQVQRGEIYGFLGHNGAGKTTTIRLLNGVLTPDSGTVTVLGYTPAVDGPALRQLTGVLTETPALDERLTGRENLTIFAELFNVPSQQVVQRVEELLAHFVLSERADEKVGTYSKGMKQRLALARALLHKPQILFLDEPTAGLDPVATQQVHQLIRHLSREQGRTIFLCTHNLHEAQTLCDRIAVLEHGRLLALGSLAELGQRLQNTQRLELEIDVAALDRAHTMFGRRERLHIESAAEGHFLLSGIPRSEVPELLAELVAAGVPVYRANPVDPTLADIYFELHGGREEAT